MRSGRAQRQRQRQRRGRHAVSGGSGNDLPGAPEAARGREAGSGLGNEAFESWSGLRGSQPPTGCSSLTRHGGTSSRTGSGPRTQHFP